VIEQQLQEIFPAIGSIADPTIRHKVIECWKRALEQGGWQPSDLHRIPFTLTLKELPAISLAQHINAVTECSIALGDILTRAYGSMLTIHTDTLIAGALLHDVGKLLEFACAENSWVVSEDGRLRRHPISGCALAAECGLPVAIQHVIATHSWEGDKGHRSPEGYLVHHSDFVNYHPFKDR